MLFKNHKTTRVARIHYIYMYEIVKEQNLLIKKMSWILLSADENVKQLELSYTGGGNVNTEQPLWTAWKIII